MTSPSRVVAFVPDLMDRSRLTAAVPDLVVERTLAGLLADAGLLELDGPTTAAGSAVGDGTGHDDGTTGDRLSDRAVDTLYVVDLSRAGAAEAVARLAAAGCRVLAFGPHVDRADLAEARSSGATVLARSALFADPARHLH